MASISKTTDTNQPYPRREHLNSHGIPAGRGDWDGEPNPRYVARHRAAELDGAR